MSRREPLVDWIEIQLTIVAVMNVDANTNRISFEARPLHAGDRPPGVRLSRGCVGEVVSVLTPVPAPQPLSTSLLVRLEARETFGFARLRLGPAGAGAFGGVLRGNLPR